MRAYKSVRCVWLCNCVDSVLHMPGGKNYRQWYAARKSMQERGRWRHSVPQQEEGEPEAQRPRLWWETPNNQLDLAPPLENSPTPQAGTSGEAAGSPGTPDSLPALENSPTEEGNGSFWLFSPCLGEGGFAFA